ncbi:MAG: NifB/NifX family molybdenum-iron cluster-binding protein [Candidatus Sulfobium sp.]|jgi:predicted Fe-Mo cluster-binding NifX family protein
MKVCFPSGGNTELDSPVYGHFGSAPVFVLVDTESKEITVLPNANQHHAHGMCNPVAALAGQTVDAVVVGGIGGGALMKLNMAGISVYKATAETIAENLAFLTSGRLPQFQPGQSCAGHTGKDGTCAH